MNADVAPLDSQEPVCQFGRVARADEFQARHEFILHGFAHVLKGGPITEADVKENVLQPDDHEMPKQPRSDLRAAIGSFV